MEQGQVLRLINQLHQLQQRLKDGKDPVATRQCERMWRSFEEAGYLVEVPLGQRYDPGRTDLEAEITTSATDGLQIREVIKPVVYWRDQQQALLLQRGVVMVGSA